MITISHTHATGTVISGSSRGDGVLPLVAQHGFRLSRQSQLIYLRGTHDRDAPTARINAAAAALREHGFAVTVEIDDQWRPAAVREAAAAHRAGERAERYDQHAGTAAARRDARQHAADQILNVIPAGQPMLPGHHSHRGDRARRERAFANLDAALTADQKVTAWAGRADAVRTHAARLADPRVVMRRIETLNAELRARQRELDAAPSVEDTADTAQHHIRREIDRLRENIAHQQQILARHAADGTFHAWGPQNLTAGDQVCGLAGCWYRVTRVNRKSVSLAGTDWPTTLTFDKIHGRRRDGLQLDTPAGEPWPVDLARAVARWQHVSHQATGNAAGSPVEQQKARHAGYARRLVHGLDLTAGDQQTAAFWPTADTPHALHERRRLAAAYLAVYDRLQAREPVPDIAASLIPDRDGAAWTMPDGDPVDRKPEQLAPGDIVVGLWDTGPHGRELWPHFQGPVDHISDPVARHGRTWTTVTLTDGTDRELRADRWLAVHPAPRL